MIIGNVLEIGIQLELIVSNYSSPSGMFNFIINQKFIPGESVEIDLFVTISFLKASLKRSSIGNMPDIGKIELTDIDFSEGAPESIIWLETGEIDGYGYWFYLGFDGDEERLIYTLNAGDTYQEARYPRGTIEKLIFSLPNAEQLDIIKKNKMITLTGFKT